MNSSQQITDLGNQAFAEMVRFRRHICQNPELGRAEYATQQFIITELEKLGLAPRIAADTGVICDIVGTTPGKTVALRADMDALPVEDALTVEYRSKIYGMKHACGHDGHVAMILGTAKIFTGLKGFPGRIRLLFQPDEEGRGGAERLIAEGAMEGVDYVLGSHLWPTLPVGKIGITFGAMMASADEFQIDILGKGGHASMPHHTIDTLHIGVQIITALKQISAQNVDPFEPALIVVGSFKAGETFNVIPENARILGSIRTYSNDIRQQLGKLLKRTVEGIAAIHGATSSVTMFPGYLPVINDNAVAKVVQSAGQILLGAENVLECRPYLASEDFSYYQREAPGCFIWVGCADSLTGKDCPLHHPRFDIDEKALLHGSSVMTLAALKLLNVMGD
ncbi:MAG: amidohydrolase [Negativicutes bacterium]|jgi:amidohydrolase